MLNRYQIPLDRCNLKFGETGVDPVTNGLFEGYASVFGGIDSFGDTIMKGAFAETIKDRDHPVLMLYGHGSQNVVGKWIHMEEDDVGLFVQGTGIQIEVAFNERRHNRQVHRIRERPPRGCERFLAVLRIERCLHRTRDGIIAAPPQPSSSGVPVSSATLSARVSVSRVSVPSFRMPPP